MDDQKNIKPDFPKQEKTASSIKRGAEDRKEKLKELHGKIKYGIWFITMDCRPLSHLPL